MRIARLGLPDLSADCASGAPFPSAMHLYYTCTPTALALTVSARIPQVHPRPR